MSTPLNTANTPSKIEEVTQFAMKNAVQAFQKQLDKLHTGRASTALLENIHVSQPHGGNKLLAHIAKVSIVDAQTLEVTAFDNWDKSIPQSVQKAITQSELGLNPEIQGNVIRVRLPALGEARRKDTVKVINKIAEEIREEVRNHRRNANAQSKTLTKNKTISEDEDRRLLNKIQKLTDDHIKQIDAFASEKIKKVLN